MNDIERLKLDIQRVIELNAQTSDRIKSDPDNFVLKLELRSGESHLHELQKQLKTFRSEKKHEVIDFRLIGEQAFMGTLPLRILSDVCGALNKVLENAAYHLQSGKDAVTGVPADFAEKLDLRLSHTSPGSTHLLITGNTSPDLSNESILQRALNKLFDLLSASNNDEFFEKAHDLGIRSSSALATLLDVLGKNKLSVEIGWAESATSTHRWNGNSGNIRMVKTLLEAIDEPEVTTEEISGFVTTLALSGSISIRPDGSKPIKIKYYKDTLESVQKLTLGQKVSLLVEKTSYYDKAKGTTNHKYKLFDIVNH